MKDKAEGKLSETLKADDNTKQSVNILKQSLEGQMAADTKDLDDQQSGKAAAEQTKATDDADLEVTERAQSVTVAARVVDAQASDFAQEPAKVKQRFASSGMTVTSEVMSLIARLNLSGCIEIAEEAYCNEETDKTEAKKSELGDDIEKSTTKIEQIVSSTLF